MSLVTGSLSSVEDGRYVTTQASRVSALSPRSRPSGFSSSSLLVGLSSDRAGLRSSQDPATAMWSHLILARAGAVGRRLHRCARTRACLAMLVVTAILGLNVHAVGGQHGFRVIDVFWVALVGWTLHIRSTEGPIPGVKSVRLRSASGSLRCSSRCIRSPCTHRVGSRTDSIAWARLAETISIVWLVPYALRKIDDVEFMLGVIAVTITADILYSIAKSAASGGLGSRLAGTNGADAHRPPRGAADRGLDPRARPAPSRPARTPVHPRDDGLVHDQVRRLDRGRWCHAGRFRRPFGGRAPKVAPSRAAHSGAAPAPRARRRWRSRRHSGPEAFPARRPSTRARRCIG